MSGSGNLRGIGFALAAMGAYATHDAIIKVLGGYYPSLQVLFFSSLLSFPLVSVVLLSDRSPGTLRPIRPGWVAVRSVCSMLTGIGGFYAFSVLPLAQVYAILFAAPLIITVLSIPILAETVGVHRWVAVMLGLIGVMIVLRPGAGDGLGLGHLAALVSACSNATVAVITRKLGGTERPLVLLMWPMLGNLALTGAALTVGYTPIALPHLAMAGAIALLGLIGGFLSILAFRSAEAAVVAPIQYSQMIWATLYGWFVFSESPDGTTVLGAVVIIASGLYILMREATPGASTNRPVIAARMRAESVTAPRSSLLQRLRPPRDQTQIDRR